MQHVTGASESDLVLHDGGDVVTVGDIPITLVHTPGTRRAASASSWTAGSWRATRSSSTAAAAPTCPGGDADEMYVSLTQRLASVPDDTVLYPGHQYSPEAFATMGATREQNYVFRLPSIEQWRMMFGLIGRMEIRDGDMATEPGRTLADELWRDLAVRYADDPSAPEPKGETDDLRPEELAPPSGRFVIVFDGAPC